MDTFSPLFERYTVTPTTNHALHLSHWGDLTNKLSSFKDGLSFFLESSDEAALGVHENTKRLSIILNSSMGIVSFARKISALDIIYKETCDLFNISTAEYPLVVRNIEYGSLWLEILGNSKVIDIVSSFISSIAEYIFRKSTDEGKISDVPKKVEALEAVLGLASKLEAEGIDATEAKEHTAKSLTIIAKQLTTIFEGESTIAINDESYLLNSEEGPKALSSNSDKPMLDYGQKSEDYDMHISYKEEWDTLDETANKPKGLQKKLELDE